MTQIQITTSLFPYLLLLLSNQLNKVKVKEEEFFAAHECRENKQRSKSRNAFLIAGETEKNNDPSRREKTHVMAGMFSDSWRARVCVCFSIDE